MADIESRRKARALANRRNLAALANDTKWGEFFNEVTRLKIPLMVKLLGETEPTESSRVWVPVENYLEGKFGPILFVFVEWVRADAVNEISAAARTIGLEYSTNNTEITVFGYK